MEQLQVRWGCEHETGNDYLTEAPLLEETSMYKEQEVKKVVTKRSMFLIRGKK
jgi:hypothetical protein